MEEKLEQVRRILRQLGSVVVAFSGGTDSSLMSKLAYDCLGDWALAVTVVSPSLSATERASAEAVARHIGIRHQFIDGQEMDDDRFRANPPNRCYYCKHEGYAQLIECARQLGYAAVVDGSNADDDSDYRPGRQAARELGVRSPLQEAGLTKAEVRAAARSLGLPNWNKPAAACLASRIPYGTPLSNELLAQVERAEQVLQALGLRQLRVRHHGPLARIEVEPDDFARVLAHRRQIVEGLQAAGYTYVTLDLAGFRSGSMNEVVAERGRP